MKFFQMSPPQTNHQTFGAAFKNILVLTRGHESQLKNTNYIGKTILKINHANYAKITFKKFYFYLNL